MADDLFSKLDTQNKSYLESSDLASASAATAARPAAPALKRCSLAGQRQRRQADQNRAERRLKKCKISWRAASRPCAPRAGATPPPTCCRKVEMVTDNSEHRQQQHQQQPMPAMTRPTNKDGTVSATEALAYALSMRVPSSSSDASPAAASLTPPPATPISPMHSA